MSNPCEGCKRNCCVDFKISSDINNPEGTRDILLRFPFIRRTGSVFVLGPGGNEIRVGIYNCGRFDPKSHRCINHDVEPRPPFCFNTGNIVAPHSECLLSRRPR